MSNAKSSAYFGSTTTFGDDTVDAQVPLTESFSLKLGDNAGGTKFSILDSDGVEVAYINSDGSASFSGGLPGFVDGAGAANQVAFWTDVDTLAGDANFLFDSVTKKFALGNDATLAVDRLIDLSHTFTDFSNNEVYGIKADYTLDPTSDLTNDVIAGYEFQTTIPSTNSFNFSPLDFSNTNYFFTHTGNGDVNYSGAFRAAAYNAGNGNITSGLTGGYFTSYNFGPGNITGLGPKTGNFAVAAGSGAVGGSITKDYVFYAEAPYDFGTMDQHYGMYLEDQEFGTASWSIFSAGGKVEFSSPEGKDTLFYMSDLDFGNNITNLQPLNTYFKLTSIHSINGGALMTGIGGADPGATAFKVGAYLGHVTPSSTTPAFLLDVGKPDGANGVASLLDTETAFNITNNGSLIFTMLGGGGVGVNTLPFSDAQFFIKTNTVLYNNALLLRDGALLLESPAGAIHNITWRRTGGSLLATMFLSATDDFVIQTAPGSGETIRFKPANSEAVRFTGAGDVGIGTASPLSRLHVNGSQSVKRTAVAAGAYAVLVTDYYIGKTAITGGGDTISLPAAATAGAGKIYIIKDESGTAGANIITIDPNGAEAIEGALTFAINVNFGSAKIICDGASWYVI